MKKTLLLLFSFCATLSVFSQMDARYWQPAASFMEDVVVADSNTILITGSNYYGTTLNAGNSWNGLSSGGMSVKAATFPSTNFGIAVGNDGYYRINTECAYFWGWGSNKFIGVSRDLRDVSFFDDQRGVVCGEMGTLMRTNNQASSFFIIPSGTVQWLNGVDMLNDSIAFACGDAGIVLKLINDSVYDSQVLNPLINFKKIYFTDENKGFLVGTNGSLYKSINQGESWTLTDLGINEDILNIDFSNNGRAAICGANGLIMISEDGGNSWSESPVLQSDEIRSIAFVNEQWLIAVASQFVLQSYDGGYTWMRANGDLRSIDFPSDSVGYATAYYGAAHRTKDGGNTWELMNINTLQYLNDINFLNVDTGYAVGGSEVFRTVDGGDTWTSLDNPAQTSLYSIDFWDDNNGVAVGYNYSIMRTTNGGLSWTYSYSWGVSQWYLDVQFTSSNTVYACSTTGAIIKSTNGGATWTNTFTGNSNQLGKLFFLDDLTGYACGQNGTIIKTTNGGDEWEILDSGTDALYLNAIHFINADTGFVAGSDGTYLRTYDGGETWFNTISGYLDFSDLTMSPNGTVWATANSVIYSIAPFNSSSSTYALCSGSDKIYFNCSQPYHDNNVSRIVNVEMTTAQDDYSNAFMLQSLQIDSVGLVNATIPETLEEGLYKYRVIDQVDLQKRSLDRYIKVINPPQLSVSLVDSMLIATCDQEVSFLWYFRLGPDDNFFYLGNTDSVNVEGSGQFYLSVNSDCCSSTINWTSIAECNGQLILEDQYTYENDYTICKGDSILVAANYYSTEGTYIDSLLSFFGCDSILVSQLFFYPSDSLYLNKSICSNEYFQVGSSTYNESGSYIDTLINVNGCDSIVYLQLSVFPISTVAIDSSICLGDSVLMASTYYSHTGSFIDTLVNSVGCDSIVTLNLTVLFQGDSIQNYSICDGDSVIVGNNIYEQSGNYIDSVYNEQDCLTVFYTSVVVNENPIVFLGNDTTICNDDFLTLDAGDAFESYLWNTNEVSQTIVVNEAGEYSVEVSDINACIGSDSVLVSVDICSSIEELEKAYGIQVFPNPSNGDFTVESAGNIGLNIYRSDGGLVFHKEILSSSERITLQESGLYLMHFILENERVIHYSLVVNK